MEMKVLTRTVHRSARAQFLAAFLSLLVIPGLARGQTWKWTTETIAPSGGSTSISVDQNQDLHISYFSDAVKYGFRAANSSHWFTMDLAGPGGYSELLPRLALDSKGNPQICFTPGILKYASFDGHEWKTQEIAPQSGLIEYSCSVAVAADGTAHVVWYQYGSRDNPFYLHLRYAILENGLWLARTVDFDGQTGKWNSLVLDAQGNPHVAYDSFLKGEMKYAYWNGKEWKKTVVDSPSISPGGPFSRGMGNSLALNKGGKAQISYEDEDSVKYAWEKDSSWKVDTIDHVTLTGSWIGYRTRQAFDPQGNPHVVYEDAGAVKHAYWDGSNWKIQVVSTAGPSKHRYEDIAVDRVGIIYISYQDATDGSVKLAIGRPQVSAQDALNEKRPEK